jgi:hypothetical protein
MIPSLDTPQDPVDPAFETGTNAVTRGAWLVLLAVAAAAAAFFAFVAASRIGYPHDLEWMEGALADHAARVADGLPLYAAPGPEHVPFLYSPLLFWLGALGMKLGLDGVLALRLVAVGSAVASALLIGHWVERAGGRVLPGLVAVGLFFAGYGWLAWWYDLARNDTLFVFAALATGYVLLEGGSRRWFWAGLLAAVALLAKQSALLWLPALGLGLLLTDWRTAVRFGLTAAGAMATSIAALHVASDGWSTFYVFEMPRHHGWVGDRKLGFWTEDLVPMLPLVALAVLGFVTACRRGAFARALPLLMFGGGAVAASWLSRMHVGGFDNVLIYAFAAGCVLGPIAAAEANGRLRLVAQGLLVLQFGLLAHRAWQRWHSEPPLPTPAHAHAHEELRAFVAAQPGPVWLPGHGHVGYRAGKGTSAHGQAIFDVLQALPKLEDGTFDLGALVERQRLAHLPPRVQNAITTLMDSTTAALREGRFAAIVVDEIGTGLFPLLFASGLVGADGRFGTDDDPYVRAPSGLLSEPNAIRPLLGYDLRAPYVMQRR